MARYPGWYTSEQVCKIECIRVNNMLLRHKVPKEKRREVTDAIKQGYWQFQQTNDFNKRFIKFVCDYFGISEKALTKAFLRHELNEIKERAEAPQHNKRE